MDQKKCPSPLIIEGAAVQSPAKNFQGRDKRKKLSNKENQCKGMGTGMTKTERFFWGNIVVDKT